MRKAGRIIILVMALMAALSLNSYLLASESTPSPKYFIDFDGDGINDNIDDSDGDGIPDNADADYMVADTSENASDSSSIDLIDFADSFGTMATPNDLLENSARFGMNKFGGRILEKNRCGFDCDADFGAGVGVGIGSSSGGGGCAGGVCR